MDKRATHEELLSFVRKFADTVQSLEGINNLSHVTTELAKEARRLIAKAEGKTQ